MNFRAKHVEGDGWYPQVKLNWRSRWMRIGKHPHGYGLYHDDDYPRKTKQDARNICRQYEIWKANRDTAKQTYEYL